MKKFILAILLMAPITIFAQKLAHFNSNEIIPNMKEYIAAQSEVEALAKQYDEDLKRMQEEFQKKYEDYEKQQANLLDNVKQRREAELQDLSQRIQQTQQDNYQAMQKIQAEKMQNIQEVLLAAVKKVGEDGSFTYIFDIATGAIPFVSPSTSNDVTPDVKKALGI